MPPAPTTSDQALTNLQGFQSSMQAPQDILSQQQQQLGVPGQQQQVSGLRQAITNTTNLLNQVAPSVYGRTQNSLVTSAQAGKQIQNEQAPLNTQLNTENQDYSGAQSELDRALQQASTAAGLKTQGQQQQLDNLKTIYGSLYQKEQDAAARELENSKLAESKREFDTGQSNAQAQADASNKVFESLYNHNNPPAAPAAPAANPLSLPGVTAKTATGNTGLLGGVLGSAGAKLAPNGKLATSGFAFSNPYTNAPISAATFANLNGINVADLLKSMAERGDSYAGKAYTELANNGAKIDQNFMNKYSSLFWGV